MEEDDFCFCYLFQVLLSLRKSQQPCHSTALWLLYQTGGWKPVVYISQHPLQLSGATWPNLPHAPLSLLCGSPDFSLSPSFPFPRWMLSIQWSSPSFCSRESHKMEDYWASESPWRRPLTEHPIGLQYNQKINFTVISHWHLGLFAVSASVTYSYLTTRLGRPYGEAWMSIYRQRMLTWSHFCWDCFKIIFLDSLATNLYDMKRGLCLESSVPVG